MQKKIRFEVFKRDSFTCQYCGRSAPDVILHVDHIKPVSKGGEDDITNLVTSCFDCNMGKKDRELSDDSVVIKARNQLAELQERREQIEMMLEWKNSLADIDQEAAEKAGEYFGKLVPGYSPNETGLKSLRRTIQKYGFEETLTCIKISSDQYLEYKNGNLDQNSVNKVFDYIDRIAKNRKYQENNPWIKDIYYIKGILKNRLRYLREYEAVALMKEAYSYGMRIDDMKELATKCDSWTDFRFQLEGWIDASQDDPNG